jgi:hypothetical protein
VSGGLSEAVEPRLRQVFAPLLSVIEDEGVRAGIATLAERYQREIVDDRSLSVEAGVPRLLARYGIGDDQTAEARGIV